MKRRVTLLLAFLCSAATLRGGETIDYRFESVRSKVTVATTATETRAVAGSVAHSGDRIRTGWFGYALLRAPRFGARFELFGGSDVRLASDTPGVLLSLERGRVKAVFDKLTGVEPRMVQTPGALLAVRGTRYGVEVARDGASTVTVFEGAVEVRSALTPEPLLVKAGEICHYSATMYPRAMPMPRGMSEGMWQRHGSSRSGDQGSGGMMAPRDGGMGGRGTSRPRSGSGHHGH